MSLFSKGTLRFLFRGQKYEELLSLPSISKNCHRNKFLNWKGDKLSWLLQSDDFKLKHPSHCFLHSTILNTHKIFKFWSPRKTPFVKFSSRVFWIDLFRNHQDYFFVVLSIYISDIYSLNQTNFFSQFCY